MGKTRTCPVLHTSGPGPLRPIIHGPARTAGNPDPNGSVAASKAQVREAKRVFERLVPRDAYDKPPDWGI